MAVPPMWIFAYGSLIFRPSFDALERRLAFLPGFRRRLWQGSPDHRGVPGAPGRVATLVSVPGPPGDADPDACGGCAYRVAPAQVEAILAALDHRESAGFVRRHLPVYASAADARTRTGAFAEALVYVADEANPHFLGALPEQEIAAWVRRSRGPSGENAEYVERLAAALEELGIVDEHVAAIARFLRDPTPA